jgi:hypothetical protein
MINIISELNGVESEEDRIVAITEIVLKLVKKEMAAIAHRPLKIIEFNKNYIWRLR